MNQDGQTKTQTLIEIISSQTFSFVTNLVQSYLLLNFVFGIEVSAVQNLHFTLTMAVISFIKAYGVRRFFNWTFHRELL